MQECLLTQDAIKEIDAVLAKGFRVELIPVKDGVKIIQIRRDEIRVSGCKSCKSWERCISAGRSGNVMKCIQFGFIQKYVIEN